MTYFGSFHVRQHFRQTTFELWKIEMTMAVDQHRPDATLRVRVRALSRSAPDGTAARHAARHAALAAVGTDRRQARHDQPHRHQHRLLVFGHLTNKNKLKKQVTGLLVGLLTTLRTCFQRTFTQATPPHRPSTMVLTWLVRVDWFG